MRRGELERSLLSEGKILVGLDEVGRGCIAGPVYTAAVILDYEQLFALSKAQLSLIRDSKTLTGKQRQHALGIIEKITFDQHLGTASEREVEDIGIAPAIFLAMRRALKACQMIPNLLLVDGNQKVTGVTMEQRAIVKGDHYCYAIAAASILAKEARDSWMREMAKTYPEYGFEQHVGYGTKLHLDKLRENGICPLHRRNFAPVTSLVPKAEAASNLS